MKFSTTCIALSATLANARSLRGLADAPTTATTEPTATDSMVGGPGSLPPAYLSIPDYKSCLSKETAGTNEQWCIPAAKPSACADANWGLMTQENMGGGLTACGSTSNKKAMSSADDGATKDAPVTDDGYAASPSNTDAAMDAYKQKMTAFMESHKAEIVAFVSKHKAAIDEAKDDIAKAIKTGDFDFANYQEQLKDIVDKHDLAAYKQKFDDYMASHKAEVKKFLDENKDILKDVEEKIKDAVASGQFDFTHYKGQLQAFVNDYDLTKYQTGMDVFMEAHKDQIESFVGANKQAVEDVAGDISDLIKTGSFDYKNFEQTIQDLVTKHDQGLSTYSPSPEQKQEIKDAVGTVKKSKAGKTLTSYAQQAQQADSPVA